MNKLPFVSTRTNYIWWFFAIESRFNSRWLPSHNLFNVTLTLDASTSHYIRKAGNAQQQFFNAAIWLIEIVGEKQSVAVQTLIHYMRLRPINRKSPVMSRRLIITIILLSFDIRCFFARKSNKKSIRNFSRPTFHYFNLEMNALYASIYLIHSFNSINLMNPRDFLKISVWTKTSLALVSSGIEKSSQGKKPYWIDTSVE